MEYRIFNIEGTALPEKSGELIFLSLSEGHRFLAESKSLAQFRNIEQGKNLSLFGERSQCELVHIAEGGKQWLVFFYTHHIGTRVSGMHSERDVRNEQERKSSLEGGGLRSDSGARRWVLALRPSEPENGQNSLWHQHLSSRKLSGREQPHWLISPQGETSSLLNKNNSFFRNFKDYNKKPLRSSRLCG